jgi:uncharacterized protein (DUF779 family)
MRVEVTDAAVEVVERAKRDRAGALVITIGTGCCESTAPFLYEDFWPGPDQEEVGRAGDVPVFAPEYLRNLYPGDDTLVLDVDTDTLAESMSIETEYACRFTLRREGQQRAPAPAAEACATVTPRQVSGELPAALRNLKLR